MKIKLKCAVVALVCLLFLPSVQALANNINGRADMQLIAKNNSFSLWANTQTGNFLLENLKTNAMWYSAVPVESIGEGVKGAVKNNLLSLFSCTVLQPSTGKATTIYSNIAAGAKKTEFVKIENGYQIRFQLQEKISVTVQVVLQSKSLNVSIPLQQISEADDVYISEIQLMPLLGAGGKSDEGFLLVPDGSGAIINFNNSVKGIYDAPVYGKDKAFIYEAMALARQDICLPVYGIQKNDDGLLAIITQSAATATIRAATAGNLTPFNSAYAAFTLRSKDEQSIAASVSQTVYEQACALQGNLSVALYPVQQKASGYIGMAGELRNYFKDELGMEELEQNGTSTVISVYGAVAQRAKILGIPMWNKAARLTSFDEAQLILKDFATIGTSTPVLELLEWDESRVLGNGISAAKPAAALGGKQALTALSDYCKQNKIPLFSGVEAVKFENNSVNTNIKRDAIRTLTQEPSQQYSYKAASYSANTALAPVYLLSTSKLDVPFSKWLRSVEKFNFTGTSFGDIGSISYSNFYKKDALSAPSTVSHMQNTIKEAAQNGDIAIHGGYAYALENANYVFNAPTQSSLLNIQNATVPFYQAAISGLCLYSSESINLQASPLQAALKALETGSLLHWEIVYTNARELLNTKLYHLGGASYKASRNYIFSLEAKFAPAASQLAGRRIIAHESIINGVVKTSFEGGVSVIVNYTNNDFTTSSAVVKANDFILEGIVK